MIYDLTVLELLPGTLGPVLPLLPQTYGSYTANGRVLGAFSCEIGALNRFSFLSVYDDTAALAAERARLMEAEDPYGIGQYLASVTSTAFKPLGFMSPIEPGAHGPFYEMRTYDLGPFGLPETEAAWAKVVPRRNEISPLLAVMASVEEGPQKLLHIYPYHSFEDRQKARAQASKEGIWPPPGGSDHVTRLANELWVAQPYSDLA